MSFHIGQQVVCVSSRFSSHPYWRSTVRAFPALGGIYTIREIVQGRGEQQGVIGFHLYEITNPLAHFDGYAEKEEPAFDSRHFRQMRPTSIEVFEKLLAPVERHGDEPRTALPSRSCQPEAETRIHNGNADDLWIGRQPHQGPCRTPVQFHLASAAAVTTTRGAPARG